MSADLTIAAIYADLLGTYGDNGNAATLLHRARLHGLSADVISIQPGDPVPSQADIYLLGGGEDTAQTAACSALRADGNIRTAAERGAAILAICAGYQLFGEYFPDSTGTRSPGLGLLDIRTDRLAQRAVGELAAAPVPAADSTEPPLFSERFTGYENHAGGTVRGPSVQPLGRVLAGVGNGDGTEGSVSGHIIGSYLHGPCLVRNPEIADQLLRWAVDRELPALEEQAVSELRAERFRTVLGH
ncbi:MAG: glutamine amidotransferase [Micrococcales bacterium]|nr:glutamine amidotransferase [Micrococcales bacterium]